MSQNQNIQVTDNFKQRFGVLLLHKTWCTQCWTYVHLLLLRSLVPLWLRYSSGLFLLTWHHPGSYHVNVHYILKLICLPVCLNSCQMLSETTGHLYISKHCADTLESVLNATQTNICAGKKCLIGSYSKQTYCIGYNRKTLFAKHADR